MTNLDSILKSRDITLPTNDLVKTMVLPVVVYGCESWTIKKVECRRIDSFELWCWRRLLRAAGLQEDPTSPSWRRSVLSVLWKDWYWSWNSNTLATWWEELTHLKRPWSWERLKVGEGDDRGWDGWMASLTQWTGVWADSGSWWWTGRPGVLQYMGSQRVGHDWATELSKYSTCFTSFHLCGNSFSVEPKSQRLVADHRFNGWDSALSLPPLDLNLRWGTEAPFQAPAGWSHQYQ